MRTGYKLGDRIQTGYRISSSFVYKALMKLKIGLQSLNFEAELKNLRVLMYAFFEKIRLTLNYLKEFFISFKK